MRSSTLYQHRGRVLPTSQPPKDPFDMNEQYFERRRDDIIDVDEISKTQPF